MFSSRIFMVKGLTLRSLNILSLFCICKGLFILPLFHLKFHTPQIQSIHTVNFPKGINNYINLTKVRTDIQTHWSQMKTALNDSSPSSHHGQALLLWRKTSVALFLQAKTPFKIQWYSFGWVPIDGSSLSQEVLGF